MANLPTIKPSVPPPLPKAKAGESDLFLTNIRLMREFYRAKPTCGQELGCNVVFESVFDSMALALQLAKEGKTWSP